MDQNISRSDKISNLPSDIIDNILICLPIHEAVKTCIFSKNWRSKWRYLSKLVFDNTFYQKSVLTSTAQPDIAKLFFNIYKVIILHHGPILNFTFHVPIFIPYPEIYQLIHYLSEKDVQEISFDIKGGLLEYYRLPSFLFSCVTLRHLTLSSCSFTVPSAFQGFVNLISLMFQWVRFDTNVFSFISKCSSLEKLSIKSCSNIGNLDIDIPSLEFFHFYGSFEAICFRKASQNLSTVIIDNAATDVNISVLESSEPTNLFQCLRNVEHLRLGSHFVDYLVEGTMPRKLSATLGWLRVLELPEIRFGWADEVSLVLCLVVSSPNLQKLEIGSVPTTYEIQSLAPEILKLQDLLDNALKKLRVVSMKLADTEVVKAELEFIKFLLAESVVLEKMFIQPAEGAVALKILKEVLRFQRSSTKAEIVYLDPDDDGEC